MLKNVSKVYILIEKSHKISNPFIFIKKSSEISSFTIHYSSFKIPNAILALFCLHFCTIYKNDIWHLNCIKINYLS